MATSLKAENKEYIPKEWEYPHCPFCDEKNFREIEKLGPDHRYTSVECNNCKLAYLHPRPKYDDEFLEIAYGSYADDADVYQKFKNNGGIPEEKTMGDILLNDLSENERKSLNNNFEFFLRIEKEFNLKKGKFLDVGCATGLTCLGAKKAGWQPTGIDISESMVRFMVDVLGIPGFVGQYHELSPVNEMAPFDLIYSSHVLEHIPNPNEWCQRFHKHLRPGGLLCLQTPANNSPDRVLKRVAKRLKLKKDNWELWRTPDHLFEPSIFPMKMLLNKHGFKILKWETYSRSDNLNQNFMSKVRHQWLKSGNNLRIFAIKE